MYCWTSIHCSKKVPCVPIYSAFFTIIEGNLTDKIIFQSTFLQAYAACKRYGFTLATEESATDTENIKNAIIEARHTTDRRLGQIF